MAIDSQVLQRHALSGHPWAVLLALGALTGCESDTLGSGGTTDGGTSASGPVTTTGSQGGSTTTATTAQGSTSGSGGGFVCDPPAEPGTLYELAASSWDFTVTEPVSMCEYRDQVLLVVNTAAV